VSRALRAFGRSVAAGMQADVQTNEVGRSAPLSAAMNYLTVAAGLPLRLLEVGAAAGLNLWMDRYFVQAGAAGWGPADSPVRLTGHFTSGQPPATAMTVVDRRGCDLNPLHPTGSRLLLESFIWPEHVGRLRLLRAAVSVAAPVLVERSSAGTWIRQQLATLHAGVTTVVFHSIVWPYLSGDERTALDDAVRAAGARADQDHRLGWVSLEPDRSGVCLTCERWPENERLVLATSSPHGTNVVWQPAPARLEASADRADMPHDHGSGRAGLVARGRNERDTSDRGPCAGGFWYNRKLLTSVFVPEIGRRLLATG